MRSHQETAVQQGQDQRDSSAAGEGVWKLGHSGKGNGATSLENSGAVCRENGRNSTLGY